MTKEISINKNIRCELVEIIITNTGTTEFPLGSLPNLRNAKAIVLVETFPVGAVALTPSGKTVVNDTVFNKAFLKLIDSENVEYRAVALKSISKTVNGTVITPVNCPQIDPEKSKIVVGTAAGLVANEAFLLQITYLKS
ncbi:MAG: hypothetical protein IT254_07110 [Chitinophagaceae bacterium]|nr:hypothetical protein [Chitinophagaceae bacterium]